jgi:hypothetical protein
VTFLDQLARREKWGQQGHLEDQLDHREKWDQLGQLDLRVQYPDQLAQLDLRVQYPDLPDHKATRAFREK